MAKRASTDQFAKSVTPKQNNTIPRSSYIMLNVYIIGIIFFNNVVVT